MNSRQALLRIVPMLMVAWARPFGLVLPGLIKTFGLSLDEAGFCITVLEIGAVTSMLILGWTMDRWGALKLISLTLALGSAALLFSAVSPSYNLLLVSFFLIGTGSAGTASSVNALMASTGERRSFYLGLAHALFGLSSIVAPIASGFIIGNSGWQAYYGLVGLAGLLFSVAFYLATRGELKNWKPNSLSEERDSVVVVLRRIGPVCLGISALVGVQGIFNSWSYLDSVERFQADHARASLVPAYFWLGILLGRMFQTFLARRFHARILLMGSCFVTVAAAQFVGLAGSLWIASVFLVVVGIGVSGAYQLGTAWAVELCPRRVGAASTFVMASASLGSGICTWITGIVVERIGFVAVPWVVTTVLAFGVVAFGVKRLER